MHLSRSQSNVILLIEDYMVKIHCGALFIYLSLFVDDKKTSKKLFMFFIIKPHSVTWSDLIIMDINFHCVLSPQTFSWFNIARQTCIFYWRSPHTQFKEHEKQNFLKMGT